MSFLNAFIAGGGAEALGGILNKAGIGQNAQAGGMFSGGFLDTSGAGGITPESVLSGQGGSVLDLVSQAQQPQQSSGGGILSKIAGGFTDDKGLFQGGEDGRLFGRIRDLLGGKKDGAAREYAQEFDPQNTDQVLEMQKKMNKLGAKLEEDGIMGPQTLGALRALQGGATDLSGTAEAAQVAQDVSNIIGIDLPASNNAPAMTPQNITPESVLSGQSGGTIQDLVQQSIASQQQASEQAQDPYGFGARSQGGQYQGGW